MSAADLTDLEVTQSITRLHFQGQHWSVDAEVLDDGEQWQLTHNGQPLTTKTFSWLEVQAIASEWVHLNDQATELQVRASKLVAVVES